jgi:hypothetical protein
MKLSIFDTVSNKDLLRPVDLCNPGDLFEVQPGVMYTTFWIHPLAVFLKFDE